MSRRRAFLVSITALILTVPWWFFDPSSITFGLPNWSLYAILMAGVYSAVLAYILEKYWQVQDPNE